MSSKLSLSKIVSILSLKSIFIFFMFGCSCLQIKAETNIQNSTPKSFIFKDAQKLNDKLFVLGKNNSVFSLKISVGSAKLENEKLNILGIYNDSINEYAWNEHELFFYNSNVSKWELLSNYKNKTIKGIISWKNEINVVFFDGLLCLKTNFFTPSPMPIKLIVKGDDNFFLCSNNFIYNLKNDGIFLKMLKLDSILFINDIFIQKKQIVYTINNNLKIVSYSNKSILSFNLLSKRNKIIGFNDNKIIAENDNGIGVFDLNKNIEEQLLNSVVFNTKTLGKGAFLYNDLEGNCIFYNSLSNEKFKIGEELKAYHIIDFFKEQEFQIILTTEGYIFKLNNENKTKFLDLSAGTGKMFSAIPNGNNLYIVCENGLLTYDMINETYYLNNNLIGIACNSIQLFEKYLYISSIENGIYKIKATKFMDEESNAILVNEGLIVSSAHLLKIYNKKLYAATNTGVYSKEIGKDKWNEYAESGFVNQITGIGHFQKSCKVLLISSLVRGVLKTNDEGHTYFPMNEGLLDSSIVSLVADSTGFYALAKNGDLYFHDHSGIEWMKISENSLKVSTMFLHGDLLYLVDNKNNIVLQENKEMKADLQFSWDVKTCYNRGEKINVKYSFTGLIGKDNYAVLQLIKSGETFLNGKVLANSDEIKGNLEYTISDSLELGTYQIRLVGTSPFLRPAKAIATFEIREEYIEKKIDAVEKQELELVQVKIRND